MNTLLEATARLFRGRGDVYAKAFAKEGQPGKVGYQLIKEPMTLDLLEGHLAGRTLLGQYQLLPDSTVYWFALDFDDDGDQGAVYTQATKQLEAFQEAGLQTYLEQSRSGTGCHVWGFFDTPIPAADVRAALKPLLVDASSFDRLYPVQTTVSESRPYGNLIALPFFGAQAPDGWSSPLGPGVPGGASVFLNTETLEPIGPETFVSVVRHNNRYVIEELASRAPIEKTADSRSDSYEPVPYGETNPAGRPAKPFNGVLKLISDYGCQFMAHAFVNRQKLPEPMWYAALQQLTCFENGRDAAHLISRDYPGYSEAETDAKYTQALRHPPVGCRYIKEHFPELACKGCAGRAPYQIGDRPIGSLAKETTEPMVHSDYKVSLERMRRRNRGEMPVGALWGTAGLDKYTRLRPKELTVVGALPSIGKAQPLTAKVLTPLGWQTMGDIRIGDLVITGSGAPTQVIGVYPQGVRPVYRVTFDDGASTECCDEHLWLTSTRRERVAKTMSDWSVKSLKEIRETLTRPDSGSPNHAIPLVGPVEFAVQGEPLPLDPYLFGLLLGDGSFRGRTYRFSNSEEDIVEYATAALAAVGDTLAHACNDDYAILGEGKGRACSYTRRTMERLELGGAFSEEKYIPDVYLYASVADRTALLRGLCDTDGSVYSGRTVEYSTTSVRLKDGVVHLARSLGGQVSVTTRTTTYTYNGAQHSGQTSYRVFIRMPEHAPAVSSAKHLSRLKSTGRAYHRNIVAVEYVGDKPVQCIAVADPSHLYVTDDFIVTHNTSLLVDAAVSLAERGVPALVFSAETGREGLEERLLARVSGVDSRAIRGERTWQGSIMPLTIDEERAVEDAAQRLHRLPLYTHYSASQPDLIVNLIEDTILRERLNLGNPLVIFMDYLQFGSLDTEGGLTEYEKLSRLSMEFKYLAKILRQPVVIFSQLKREKESDDEPQINWFKGTGRIEADADVAMILTGERTPGAVAKRKISIVKQREGEAGISLDLLLHQAVSRFEPAPTITEDTVTKDIFSMTPNAFVD